MEVTWIDRETGRERTEQFPTGKYAYYDGENLLDIETKKVINKKPICFQQVGHLAGSNSVRVVEIIEDWFG